MVRPSLRDDLPLLALQILQALLADRRQKLISAGSKFSNGAEALPRSIEGSSFSLYSSNLLTQLGLFRYAHVVQHLAAHIDALVRLVHLCGEPGRAAGGVRRLELVWPRRPAGTQAWTAAPPPPPPCQGGALSVRKSGGAGNPRSRARQPAEEAEKEHSLSSGSTRRRAGVCSGRAPVKRRRVRERLGRRVLPAPAAAIALKQQRRRTHAHASAEGGGAAHLVDVAATMAPPFSGASGGRSSCEPARSDSCDSLVPSGSAASAAPAPCSAAIALWSAMTSNGAGAPSQCERSASGGRVAPAQPRLQLASSVDVDTRHHAPWTCAE